jgi:hypothetical protein
MRAEENLHFRSPSDFPSPTLTSLNKTIIPPTLEHIMNIVIPSAFALVNSNNPLYHLRNL